VVIDFCHVFPPYEFHTNHYNTKLTDQPSSAVRQV
jgi:hypothetical protein